MAFRIYTKTGDKGDTALFGGRRVPKSHLRVDAYGTVDELNAFIGMLRDTQNDEHLREILAEIQNRLFSLGAHLASDPAKNPTPPDFKSEDVQLLESEIDAMDAVLPPLKNFILPGGHLSVSVCHVCRTVCRRAERLVVALSRRSPVDTLAIQYLNRLSDYFFVLSRHLAHQLDADEVIWKPRKT
ncbi:MAG: cob(I)yrinic acid a,c-diamide adenosyltransferase [Saprospiraceae bacterium]|nr:cob(I)yrinic acid a,c-diamide adenosyltransferase [Saprospiraceae bacterium]